MATRERCPPLNSLKLSFHFPFSSIPISHPSTTPLGKGISLAVLPGSIPDNILPNESVTSLQVCSTAVNLCLSNSSIAPSILHLSACTWVNIVASFSSSCSATSIMLITC
eukprot:NODE_238_length_13323_cov_0.463854.p10 type:complete len:110 gc:universal NODE_238_length_13323_cov_0.463854:9886-10215(+)